MGHLTLINVYLRYFFYIKRNFWLLGHVKARKSIFLRRFERQLQLGLLARLSNRLRVDRDVEQARSTIRHLFVDLEHPSEADDLLLVLNREIEAEGAVLAGGELLIPGSNEEFLACFHFQVLDMHAANNEDVLNVLVFVEVDGSLVDFLVRVLCHHHQVLL